MPFSINNEKQNSPSVLAHPQMTSPDSLSVESKNNAVESKNNCAQNREILNYMTTFV
jgi:hypothetical protein